MVNKSSAVSKSKVKTALKNFHDDAARLFIQLDSIKHAVIARGEQDLSRQDSSNGRDDLGRRKNKLLKELRSIKKITDKLKSCLDGLERGLYVNVYQAAGNSIRKTGSVDCNYETVKFDPNKVFELPKAVNAVIKIIRSTYEKAFIVIDAIRNPFEARFFKDRYSAFYLVSVNAPNSDREKYLGNVRKFTGEQIKEMDKIESGSGDKNEFVGQNVKKCIEISDIHLFNPRNEIGNNNILKSQLAWYLSLMMHPGLVSPSSMERIMQIAYTAKTNSGCISRQVGAVVTDKNKSVKAVGWNDVPHGQVPCALRSTEKAINGFDKIEYSEFERNNKEFRDVVKVIDDKYKNKKELMKGRNPSYCFKDIKNVLDGKGNQVHTRSLHAEENAFLQISKYGGAGVEGGFLYTTASPCELCAKKAYQLGVSKIVFIDPYPGITTDHILANGDNSPELVQFRGAVGKGYFQLYEQTLPYKDELLHFNDNVLGEMANDKKIENAKKIIERL
ncbi:deoxycytidylate deaminase [Larsenimonas rhizosphaerae]|uniref:deoxycytidylate deaminase n=1 Tax=Larsenimonas rhizosphaerae TaxID=2944682 RepID=UPI002033619B|nr:deoxycytidylate deaminase [Larsenimonas rhizosphaerae]